MTLFISPWIDHPWMPSPVSVQPQSIMARWPIPSPSLPVSGSTLGPAGPIVPPWTEVRSWPAQPSQENPRWFPRSLQPFQHLASFCHILWTYKNCLVVSSPLKNMKVRLDHHPNYWGKSKMFQTNNQQNIETLKLRLLPSGVLKHGWPEESPLTSMIFPANHP